MTENRLAIIGYIDEQLVDKADNYTVSGKKRPIWIKVLVAACLCLFFSCSVSVLAVVGINHAYEILNLISPDIAQKLKPVNSSCEDNGIEMTVVAAEADGETTNILVSFHDNEGDRVDETMDLFDSYVIHTPHDQSGSCFFVSYDEETKTAIFMITIDQMDHALIPGDKITFSVSRLLCGREHSDFKLTQINTENVREVTDFMKDPYFRGAGGQYNKDIDGESLLLMKPDDANEVSLKKGVTLTGYGFVEGQLHIQLRYDDIRNTDNHGYIYLKNRDGEVLDCDANISFWDKNVADSYEEYLFPVTAEELGDYEIYGEFWTCNIGPIKGSWKISFPINAPEPEN